MYTYLKQLLQKPDLTTFFLKVLKLLLSTLVEYQAELNEAKNNTKTEIPNAILMILPDDSDLK